jgi:carboxymethylenebutenolidase
MAIRGVDNTHQNNSIHAIAVQNFSSGHHQMTNFSRTASFCRVILTFCAFSVCTVSQAQTFSGSVGNSLEQFSSMGRRVNVEVFNPSIPGRRPAIIILHGADGLVENGPIFREIGEGLAKAGYAAFLVHYFDVNGISSLPEHMQKKALNPQSFGVWMQTVNSAIQYVNCHQNVDPTRIGIFGVSLGGYLATSVAATNPQVRAVVDVFGGIPDQFVFAIRRMPPVLFLHGDADSRVPVTEAYKLHCMLSQAGVPNQIKIYHGQGHQLTGAAREDAKKRVLDFLNCSLQ